MKVTNTKMETLAELLSSSKDPQGKNGGGSSSAPASPLLNGNVIKTKNGVKTTILEMEEQKASDVMAALHAENMKAIEQVEETKEHFGISGAPKFNLNKRIEELGLPRFIGTAIHYTFKGTVWDPSTEPLPPATNYYGIPMVSIYSSNFLDTLLTYIDTILKSSNHPTPYFNLIIEVLLETGQVRTVGGGFIVEPTTDLVQLKEMLEGYIENFETQSGIPEERQEEAVVSSLIKVMNRSSAPNVNWNDPLSLPQGSKTPETSAKPSRKSPVRATAEKLAILNSQLNTGFESLNASNAELKSTIISSNEKLIEAIKSTPSVPFISGVNWTPILHGITNVIVSSLGGTVQFAQPSPAPSPTPTPASTQPSEVMVSQIKELIKTEMAPLVTKISSFESALTTLVQTQTELTKGLSDLAKTTNSRFDRIASLMELQIKATSTSSGGSSNGGGTSSAPASPVQVSTEEESPNIFHPKPTNLAAVLAKVNEGIKGEAPEAPIFSDRSNHDPYQNHPLLPPPENTKAESPSSVGLVSYPEIETLPPTKNKIDLNNKIVCADLESLILPNGKNKVYMAAWYNEKSQSILDITQWGNNTQTMLEQFWIDLINQNQGRICYFHNFGGYDAILSLPALVRLPFTFSPIMKDGEIIAIRVLGKKNKELLTIKDSIRILPGALSKLAKDWGAETQKDHFPHYFWNRSIEETLSYQGPIPAYSYFEPKRTSPKDYEEMVQEFKNRTWSFLDVSRKYILGDVKATYQVLIKYFETLISKFPIDPTKIYSAPSAAFRIWRTTQLPILHKDGQEVYDISHSLDSQLRATYCGGIVDVYRPHLQGEGYYYDVNSLYPTAMCKPMPVGIPIERSLTTSDFYNERKFIGFVEATVQAPINEYIGLLPIKHQGKLLCPGGRFKGLFFSEELRFAIDNGYTLLEITKGFQFREGKHTFLDLITQLNEMKITAQREGKPTIRNLAKLLMNSMYGRFGMHPSLTKTQFHTQEGIENLSQYWDLKNRIDFGEMNLVTLELAKEWILQNKGEQELIKNLMDLGNKTNVAIAAAVTAHSRMIINTFKLLAMKLGLQIYYSDTDSLVVNGPLPEEYLDSAKLGKLKLEHTIREGIFVMPKVYYLESTEGEIVTKCKGFAGKLTKVQYLDLLKGNSQHLQVTKWSKSLKESTVRILRNQSYDLTFSFNKRKRIFKNGVWVNTAPLILN